MACYVSLATFTPRIQNLIIEYLYTQPLVGSNERLIQRDNIMEPLIRVAYYECTGTHLHIGGRRHHEGDYKNDQLNLAQRLHDLNPQLARLNQF